MRYVFAVLFMAVAGLTTAPAAQAAVTPGQTVQVVHVQGRTDLAFTGTKGRVPTVLVVDESLANPASIALVRPNGTATAAKQFTAAPWFGEYPKLDVSGAWKLSITPAAGDTGDVRLLISYARTAAPALPSGANRTITLSEPGTVQAYTFTGTAGQRPILSAPTNTWTSATGITQYPAIHAGLYRPDGTEWTDFQAICGGCSKPFQEPRTFPDVLPVSGTWTILFSGIDDSVGSSRFHLSLVDDQKVALTPGAAVTAKVPTRGQNIVYSFDATAGQSPVADLLSQTWTRADGSATYAIMVLYRPDGTYFDTWGRTDDGNRDPATWFESRPLDATGRWTLVVDPLDDAAGSQRMVVDTVTDPAPRAVALGRQVRVASPTAGANTDLTLPAQPGKRLVVNVGASTWRSRTGSPTVVTAELLNAAGETLGYTRLPASGAADIAGPANSTGTWTLRLNPDGDTTGPTTLTLTTVTDVTGALTLGTPSTVTFTQPYQQARLSFDNLPDGTMARVQITGSTLPGAKFTIPGQYGSDSAELTEAGDGDLLLLTADWVPTQTLVIDPTGPASGALTVKITAW